MSSLFHDSGTLHMIPGGTGISRVSWLYTFPMAAVIIANVWRKERRFSMLAYQAALDDVPSDIEESSKLDRGEPGQENLLYYSADHQKYDHDKYHADHTDDAWIFRPDLDHDRRGSQRKDPDASDLMYIKAFKNSQLGYGVAISIISWWWA